MRRRHVHLLAALATALGCSDPPARPAASTETPHAAPEASTPPPRLAPPPGTRTATPMQVEWGRHRATDGCFFFSGPDGRDDRLGGLALVEADGVRVRITFGDAEFVGRQSSGTVDLARVSPHEFGTRWLVTETLRGSYQQRSMRLVYTYRECQSGAPCPGRCTIAGELTLRGP